MNWDNTEKGTSINYVCGYCGSDIVSDVGYKAFLNGYFTGDVIRICHKCHKPTFIDRNKNATPGAIYGQKISNLPVEVENIYDEARKCFSINAYTSVIMCCRKLLMHIACESGAPAEQKFGVYVQYLKEQGYIAKPSHKLADAILKYGNIANHKLEVYSQRDAEHIMLFTEAILKNIYELPSVHDKLIAAESK